jgi:hypothetical protein
MLCNSRFASIGERSIHSRRCAVDGARHIAIVASASTRPSAIAASTGESRSASSELWARSHPSAQCRADETGRRERAHVAYRVVCVCVESLSAALVRCEGSRRVVECCQHMNKRFVEGAILWEREIEHRIASAVSASSDAFWAQSVGEPRLTTGLKWCFSRCTDRIASLQTEVT